MGGVHWLSFLLIRINPSLIHLRKITMCLNNDSDWKNCFLNVVNHCLCFNHQCIQNIQMESDLLRRDMKGYDKYYIKLINWTHTLHGKCISKAHYRWVDCFLTFAVILYVACLMVNKYSIYIVRKIMKKGLMRIDHIVCHFLGIYLIILPWVTLETLITARAEDTQHGPKGCITVRFKNCDYIIVNEPPKRRIQKPSN